MQVHAPVEKNHKHKTDSMSWKDVPQQGCDLNFRPPSWSKLSKTASATYGELLVAASVAVGSLIAIHVCVLPWLWQASWITVFAVATFISILVSSGWYRPLPRVFGEQDTVRMGLLVAFGLLACITIIRISVLLDSFDLGVMLLFSITIPSCLCLADQLTGHMLHWWSAAPTVGRSTMVLWRNAWQGRFMTCHVDELSTIGIAEERVTRLKRYWLWHVVVIAIYATSMLAAILAASEYRSANAAFLFLLNATVLLFLAAVVADWQTLANRQNTSQILGQWFLYLKDTIQPPWVLPSPAGNQLIRAFHAYVAAGLLAVAFVLLGHSVANPSMPAAQVPTRVTIVAVAVLLAPFHLLLICFLVAAPTLSQVEAGLKCEHNAEGTQ